MNYIKNLFSNPITKKILIIFGIFLFIVIFIIIIASCSNKKTYTYSELEAKMVSLAKNKYKNKKEDLPKNDKDILEVSLQSFVDDKSLKNIKSITTDKVHCTGNVKIINNYGNYLYIPYLDCNDSYKTKTIYDTLTDDNNIVISGNGLYKVNSEYIYKGDNVNNYLKINDTEYRILRINDDKTIRLLDTTKRGSIVWDDRYNIDKDREIGINNYTYNGVNSRIKESIEELYNDKDLFTDDVKALFVSKPLCVGKRSINDNIFDRSIECSQTIEAYPFGLLEANEFFASTLDNNCNNFESLSCLNYNYLADISSTWTITADKDTSYKAYKISNDGLVISNTSTTTPVKIVVTINPDLVINGGDGSKENPYTVKTYINKKSS